MNKIFILIVISFGFSQHIDCVGSSITRNGYPDYTNTMMETNGYLWQVHNYGVSGAGVVVNAYKDSIEYTEVVCREAEVVVLLLGANDWNFYSAANQIDRDNWKSEYIKLVTEFQKNSLVVLGYLIHRVPINDADSTLANVTLANATMDEMNVVINQIANIYQLHIIDFKTAIGTDPAHFWTSDGLHPNDSGSELMGIEAYEYLKTLVSLERDVNDCLNLEIDDEYWSAVEDYEQQKKIGWFSCDGN